MEKLTKDNLRVLRLLSIEKAVEEEGHELKSIRPLEARGLVRVGQWERYRHRGQTWRQRDVSITPAGHRALSEGSAL
ncbi:hypothetical protein [Bosea vaviloviae]|uniref:hypothetical protein n=1 Tax=Bosea vaviloviae TaxID=1526658 RepID=UPI000A4C6490|nr:hypothetical protein [Bosea vaviloviae]